MRSSAKPKQPALALPVERNTGRTHYPPRSKFHRLPALDDGAEDVERKPAHPDEPFKVPSVVVGNEDMRLTG